MQIENGKIYDGTVKNIAKYGVFVDITNPENQRIMGMVHISEISHSYVSEIRDFVSEGQSVKVKVIAIGENGKISLSMKQAETVQPKQKQPSPQKRERESKPNVWEPKKKQPKGEETFEDMLSRFKQNSEERMCDIKRSTERKNHSRRK